MNKKQMINTIYKTIANKSLSFWCKVMWRDAKTLLWNDDIVTIWNDSQTFATRYTDMKSKRTQIDAIRHPVMIWDVLDYIWNKYWEFSFTIWWNWIINFWERQWKFNLRKPIEEQSEECIDYLYNLLTDRLNEK